MPSVKIPNGSGGWIKIPTVKGDKGDKGDTGAQGPQGETGPQGPQGIQGVQGVAGTSSAYTAASNAGYTGTETEFNQALAEVPNKANKKVPAATGNLAALDSTGNLADSGKKSGDFAAAAHTHTFDSVTGKPSSYSPSHDRRPAKIVIGSSTAGYTAVDCDYICDGTDDQEEINNAIAALATAGGRILLLDGAYSITANITISKANVELCGTGGAKLTFANSGYIKIAADSCNVHDLVLIGTQTAASKPVLLAQSCTKAKIYSLRVSKGEIQLDTCTNSIVTGNFIGESNNYNYGVCLKSGSHNIVTGNNLTSAYFCVSATGEKKLTVSQNIADAFNDCGIYLDTCEDAVVTSNNFSTTVGGSILGIGCTNSARILIGDNSINMDEPGGDTFACIEISGSSKSMISGNMLRDISAHQLIDVSSSTNTLIANNVMVSDYATKINTTDSSGITQVNNYSYGL